MFRELTHRILIRKLLLTLGDRLMVGLQFLDLPIGVRIPVSQPRISSQLSVASGQKFSETDH